MKKSGINGFLLHPVAGVLVLFAVLAVFLFVLGKVIAIDVTDFVYGTVFTGLLLPKAAGAVAAVTPEGSLFYVLLVGEYGLFNMGLGYLFGIIVPIVAGFYLLMAIVTESGYIHYIAVLSNKGLKKIGLTGALTVPIVLGFGCITMAFVAISSLKSQRERFIASTLIALTVPCSAQFGLINGRLTALGAAYVLLYFAVLVVLFVVTGAVLNHILPPDMAKTSLTVPPLRRPSARVVLTQTGSAVWEFITEAAPVFLLAAAVLTFLQRYGGLAALYTAMAPLTEGVLLLPAETSMAFILSIIRREFGVVALANATLTPNQTVVALVTMTLLVPCISAIFVLYKQRGPKEATAICLFCTVTAFAVGGLLARMLAWAF